MIEAGIIKFDTHTVIGEGPQLVVIWGQKVNGQGHTARNYVSMGCAVGMLVRLTLHNRAVQLLTGVHVADR